MFPGASSHSRLLVLIFAGTLLSCRIQVPVVVGASDVPGCPLLSQATGLDFCRNSFFLQNSSFALWMSSLSELGGARSGWDHPRRRESPWGTQGFQWLIRKSGSGAPGARGARGISAATISLLLLLPFKDRWQILGDAHAI